MKHVRIFDTTLRDGAQTPGFTMKKEDKVAFAKRLEALGVDVIEVGFPSEHPQDFEVIVEIAKICQNVEVCVLSRCNEKAIDCTIRALKGATRPRIHVFIGTSDEYMQHQLKMSREEVIEKAINGVKQAREFTSRVDFSAEDGSRADRKFLKEILEEVIIAGADVVNIADSMGCMTPEEYGALIAYVSTHVKGIDKVIISTHCHDDLGLAVANSLAGVLNGARQIECTVNGIGKRAGNADLRKVIMALKTKSDIYGAQTSIHASELLDASKYLSQITAHIERNL